VAKWKVTSHIQWRDRAGFSPASLLCPDGHPKQPTDYSTGISIAAHNQCQTRSRVAIANMKPQPPRVTCDPNDNLLTSMDYQQLRRPNAGPDLTRRFTPSSRDNVGQPSLAQPGGAEKRVWSSASPRLLAASIDLPRTCLMRCWPMNSASERGS
jgi:hypothetical protein